MIRSEKINGRNVSGVRLSRKKLDYIRLVTEQQHRANKIRESSLLVRNVCKSLMDSRGYSGIWIAILDQNKNVVDLVEAGNETRVISIMDLIKKGDLPSSVVERNNKTQDITSLSDNCRLSILEEDDELRTLTAQINFGSNLYGVMTVYFDLHRNSKDEVKFLSGISEELGYALHTIQNNERSFSFIDIDDEEALLVN